MPRARRLVVRFLFAAAVGGAAYVGWVSTFGSPATVDLLPSGALAVVEARDLEALSGRFSGTRFSAAFAESATRAWLERTGPVAAFDAALAEIRRVGRVPLGRGSAFDLLGEQAAVAWYPPIDGGATAVRWVAGGRLSLRAWAAATALRLGPGLGFGPPELTREQLAGRTLYSFPGSDGQALHLLLVGRVLVGSPDRALALDAARVAGDATGAVTREPAWQAIRGALPGHGELFLWVRDESSLSGAVPAGRTGHGSVGALMRAGKTVEIDVVASPASARKTPGADRIPLPALALSRQAPLLLLTSRAPVPAAGLDLLLSRQRAVSRRTGAAAASGTVEPGNGFAIVVTDSAGGTGLFPAPRGLVAVSMTSAAEAARVLPTLFPPGAKTGTGGGSRALATRESFPLAGEFELWGAAVGSQLVFATDTALIDAAAAAATAVREDPADTAWPVESVCVVSMEKLLPLARRWSAPLSGLLAARWPEAPDLTRDLGLLAAIGTLRVAAGSDERFERAAITFDVRDLR